MEVIKMQGEVLMSKRYWWQLYKKGWYKHKDFWGCLWWIRFKWSKQDEQLEEPKQDRTCTNNCSVVCGECQIFKPKQETLEDKLDRIVSKEPSKFLEESDKRMEAKAKLFRYSEEEVRKISLDFFYYWWNSKGTNTEQGFDEWFEQFKKK